MKSKIVFILSILILVFSVISFGQSEHQGNIEDREMNVFLSTLLILAVCIMIGTGIIAALIILFILFLLLAILAFGIVSTSVIIALYNRSVSSGFKSFLMITFGLGSGILGTLSILMVNEIYNLSISKSVLGITGFISGTIGGIILSLVAIKLLRQAIKYIKVKFVSA